MASMVPCLHPTQCGVQTHIAGSDAERNCGKVTESVRSSLGVGMTLANNVSPYRDLSDEDPAGIDEEIRTTENSIIDARWEIDRASKFEAEFENYGEAKRNRMRDTLNTLIEERSTAYVTLRELTANLEQLEEEYEVRGGWPRYFLATNNNGHVHSSVACSTCNNGRRATSFSWKTSFSGRPESEVVELMGDRCCTVCYPDAPVEIRERPYAMYSDEEKAEMAEKQAKKEAEAEEAESKGIWNPDGSPLRLTEGDTMRTQRSAEIRAAADLSSILWYNQEVHPLGTEDGERQVEQSAVTLRSMSGMSLEEARVSVRSAWQPRVKEHPSTYHWVKDIKLIATAVANKTGEPYDEVITRFKEKAWAKHRRDDGNGTMAPLDGLF